MKSPSQIRDETLKTEEADSALRHEKIILRLEQFMCDIPSSGKSDDWYEGYSDLENSEAQYWISEELNKNGWHATFTRKREKMYTLSGEPGGCGIRTILTVRPM